MTNQPKSNLSEHDKEAIPVDDVMRKLIDAKPTPKRAPEIPEPDPPAD